MTSTEISREVKRVAEAISGLELGRDDRDPEAFDDEHWFELARRAIAAMWIHTEGMSIERKAAYIADAPRPVLDRSGHRWRTIYDRALVALRETAPKDGGV